MRGGVDPHPTQLLLVGVQEGQSAAIWSRCMLPLHVQQQLRRVMMRLRRRASASGVLFLRRRRRKEGGNRRCSNS